MPSANDIVLSIRDGMSLGERVVYVDNRSSSAVVITSLRLMDCENVQGGCVTIRVNQRVPAGSQIMLRRIRARFEDKGFGFRVGFSWQPESAGGEPAGALAATDQSAVPAPPPPPAPLPPAAEPVVQPSAPVQPRAALVLDSVANPGVYKVVADAITADAAADPAVVDSVQVLPATGLALRVGQVLDLREALTIRAFNVAKRVIPGVQVRIRVEVGPLVVRLERGTLTGLAPGTAVLYFGPPNPPGVVGGEPKGASRIVVRVY